MELIILAIALYMWYLGAPFIVILSVVLFLAGIVFLFD